MPWVPTHPARSLPVPDLAALMAASTAEVAETWALAGRLAARRQRDETRLREAWADVHGSPSTSPETLPARTPAAVSPTDLIRALVVRHTALVASLAEDPADWSGLPPAAEARLLLQEAAERFRARPDDPDEITAIAPDWARRWALALAMDPPRLGAVELLAAVDPSLEPIARLLCPRGGWIHACEVLRQALGGQCAWALPPEPPYQLARAADLAWVADALREAAGVLLLGGRSARALADIATYRCGLDPQDRRFDGGEQMWIRSRCVDERAFLTLGPDAVVHLLSRDPARRLRDELTWVPIARVSAAIDAARQGSGDAVLLVVPPEAEGELVSAIPAAGALPRRAVPEAPALLVELCLRWPPGAVDPPRALGEAIAALRRVEKEFHPWLRPTVRPDLHTARRWLRAWSLLPPAQAGRDGLSDADERFIQEHGGSPEEVRALLVALGELSARAGAATMSREGPPG